jgi:hypothetical protein
LPPVQQGREFNSLDTAGNSEPQEQAVKVGFHSSTSHLELAGNLGVIASLQQQFYDLLFARTEPDSLLLHPSLPVFWILPVARIRRTANCQKVAAPTLPLLPFFACCDWKPYFPQALAGILRWLQRRIFAL